MKFRSDHYRKIGCHRLKKNHLQTVYDNAGEVELTLPKAMIEGITAVIAGDKEIQFEQTSTTDTSTTIKFTVPEGFTSVDIMGAKVIPEFPVIAALILGISLVAIVGYTRFAKSATVAGFLGRA